MIQRAVRASVSGWGPWAIGAVVSAGCAALIFVRLRAAWRTSAAYEAWWRDREILRLNGHKRPSQDGQPDSSQMFV